MQKTYIITVDPATGASRPFCHVAVFVAGGDTHAILYDDNETLILQNPIESDSAGRSAFKTFDGDYDITVSGDGFESYTYTNIQIVDKDSFTPAGAVAIPTGVILPFGGVNPPLGYLLCDGQLVSRAEHSALFLVVGTTYGVGDNATTFNLPNFRGRSPMGVGPSGLGNTYVLGQQFGEDQHVITSTEMTWHAHTIVDSGHVHGLGDPGHAHGVNDPGHTHHTQIELATPGAGSGWYPSGGGVVELRPTTASLTGISTASSGTGQFVNGALTGVQVAFEGGSIGHNTVHPILAVHFIIKT